MNINKNTLWKVPLFCIVAGIITFNAILYFLGRIMLVTLPDGTITPDNSCVLIVHGAVFIVTLIVGGIFFFRNMTRKEIFFSASIWVTISLVLIIIQWMFNLTTGPGAIFYIYVSRVFEWSNIIPQLLYRVNDNLWLNALISCFTPYVFILFGKKD